MHDKVNINEFLIDEERSREQSKHVSTYTHNNAHINSKKNSRYLNVCFFFKVGSNFGDTLPSPLLSFQLIFVA